MNLYTYVHNNPLIYADPTGHWCSSAAKDVNGMPMYSHPGNDCAYGSTYENNDNILIRTVIYNGKPTITWTNIAMIDELAREQKAKKLESAQNLLKFMEDISGATTIRALTSTDQIESWGAMLSIVGPGSLFKLPKTTFNTKKLQHEFKHASDFGVIGNWNKATGEIYEKAILRHIDTSKDIYKSTYRGQDVYVHFNQSTNVGTYTDLSGQYIGGWKFNVNQINYHISNGIKIK